MKSPLKITGLDLVHGGLGWLLGGFAYVVATGLTLAFAPRQAENVRDVVTMPWMVFVTLPTFAAIVVGMMAGLTLPKTLLSRLAFALGVAVAIGLANYCCADLFRRAYIGKL
jgi:hypothetical protein